MRACQVSQLDKLMVAESGIAISDDQMSLAGDNWKTGSQLCSLRATSIDHAVARNPLATNQYLARTDSVHACSFPQLCTVCDGALDKCERSVWRIYDSCLLYTSPSPRDRQKSRM